MFLLDTSGPLAKILNLADDAIISIDAEQRILLFNQGAERIFGYSAEEVQGRLLDLLLPSRLVEVHRQHIHHFAESSDTARRMGERSEIHARRKDGSEFVAEASISKVDIGAERLDTVILRDVTERAIADEKIRTALREKEALLKEIHHRVKNNLQVVSSLLGLQSRTVTDPEIRKMFRDSQDRVFAMALLHESVYQSANLSAIDFPVYIKQLADHIFRTYGVGGNRVRLHTELAPLSLTLDTALPCGLIINELLSNSLKYAFPGEREGEIRINLYGQPGNIAKLVISDNGVGLPNDIDWVNTRSLGLRLVRSLAQQLGAQIEVRPPPGTEVRLTFSAAASAAQQISGIRKSRGCPAILKVATRVQLASDPCLVPPQYPHQRAAFETPIPFTTGGERATQDCTRPCGRCDVPSKHLTPTMAENSRNQRSFLSNTIEPLPIDSIGACRPDASDPLHSIFENARADKTVPRRGRSVRGENSSLEK